MNTVTGTALSQPLAKVFGTIYHRAVTMLDGYSLGLNMEVGDGLN